MSRFAEYVLGRKIDELAHICDERGIDCSELESICEGLLHEGMNPEEVYNEFVGRMLNWAGQKVGNLAQGAVGMGGRMLGTAARWGQQLYNAGKQGVQQGYGQQNQQGGPQQGGSQTGGPQTAAAGGPQTAQQLNNVRGMLQQMGQQYQQINKVVDTLTKQLQTSGAK